MCDGCFNIRHNYGQNIKHIVRDHYVTFESSLEFMVKDEISPTYASFLCDFNKYSDERLSEESLNIHDRIKLTLNYYGEAKKYLRKIC